LKNIVALAPRKLICVKIVASGISSAGVCSSARIGPARSGAATVRITLVMALRNTPVATERRTAASSLAPNAWAIGIANPLVRPQANPSSRNSRLPVAPTAARDVTPRCRPTTIASANWYSCCTTLPRRRGIEKARMTRHGRPVVREVAMRERLAELGKRIGAAQAYRIDSAEHIPPFPLRGHTGSVSEVGGIVNYSASACRPPRGPAAESMTTGGARE